MIGCPTKLGGKNVLPKIEAVGLAATELKRCVYVIRLNGDHCISYASGTSPTLYVGESNFNQRINSHRKWVTGLKELVGDFSFQVCIAVPRVRNSPAAYLDTEAAILERFGKHFKSAHLWNKQFESRRNA